MLRLAVKSLINNKVSIFILKHIGANIMLEIVIDLPCTLFASRLSLEIDDMFNANEDFTHVFDLNQIQSQYNDLEAFKETILITKNLSDEQRKRNS